MPNGFHGSVEEWRKLEAPYLRVDPILAEFAEQHGLVLQKNYHAANRALNWQDGVQRAIWNSSMDKYGESSTYQVAVLAYQDRGAERYTKHGIVANSVGIATLAQMLERARAILAGWSENELHLPKPGGEPSELL